MQEELEHFEDFSSSEDSDSDEGSYASDSDVSFHGFSPATSDDELYSDSEDQQSGLSSDEDGGNELESLAEGKDKY